jgi:hypothetical protein
MYWLGTSTIPAFPAWCDMTTSGGGWTRVMYKLAGDGTALRVDSAVGTPGSTVVNNKLSSDQINAILGGAPYEAMAYRVASNEYFRTNGNIKSFNWSTLDSNDSWASSACTPGSSIYRSTDGATFTPYNTAAVPYAMISDCTSWNKGAYFHWGNGGYRLRAFIKTESEASGYDFNESRNSSSAWLVRPAVVVGTSTAPAGASCNAAKTAGLRKGDGLYWIQPSGQAATQVWCDMTTDSGGWTLVTEYLNGANGNGVSLLAGAENATELTNDSVAGRAKFADAFINALPWTSYRIDLAGDPTRQIRTDNRFTVQWNAASGAVNGTLNGHNLSWCYGGTPAAGTQCSTLGNTNTYGVSPHEGGLGGHWIHGPTSATIGGFSCGFGGAAETSCSRYSDSFGVRHWVR